MNFKIRMAMLAVATTGLFSITAMEAQAARCGGASGMHSPPARHRANA